MKAAFDNLRTEYAAKVFGDSAFSYASLEDALNSSIGFHYHIEDVERYRSMASNVTRTNRVYWEEMLDRAHLAAVTSLSRSILWALASIDGYRTSNVFGFASSVRGLLEAAGDSIFSLKDVPLQLATEYKTIKQCLSGAKRDLVVLNAELEERLLHFQFARRRDPADPDIPREHRAESSQTYLRPINSILNAEHLYKLLCELTHPAHMSASFMVDGEDVSTGTRFQVVPDIQRPFIEGIIEEYRLVFSGILSLACNPSLLVLATLIAFERYPPLRSIGDLSQIPAWSQINAAFLKHGLYPSRK